MYQLSNSEFIQYRIAERRLQDIRKQHAHELQKAYADIHPTITRIDPALGRLYVESVNPETYAIYLIELQEEHKEIENWWAERAKVFKQAYEEAGGDLEKTREILSRIISTRSDLQRKQVNVTLFDDVEKYDAKIDSMTDDELFKDYQDLEDENSEERIREQCISLYENYDMTINEIASFLGITTARVKKHIKKYLRTEGSAY